jgi:predicted membrane protein|nr:MAG TPA: Putative ABC-transporter type IV [Caudoviricetes sp.]
MKIPTVSKNIILFAVGGTLYYGIEFLYKTFISFGTCHWSMFLLGGLCFLLIGLMNENVLWEESILTQGVKGSLIITALELIFGLVLNVKLGLGIWDYSHVPLNFMG